MMAAAGIAPKVPGYQAEEEDGCGPPEMVRWCVDDAEADSQGGCAVRTRSANGAAVLPARTGPPPPTPSYPGGGQRTLRCRFCASNNFPYCDALHDPDDAYRSLGCTRCTRWGLGCLTETALELPVHEDAAGTGPIQDLLFPPCQQCKQANRRCDR